MATPTPYQAFRSLLDGQPPDPRVPDLGPFAQYYSLLSEVAPEGLPAVRRRFDALAADHPDLARLMANAPAASPGREAEPRNRVPRLLTIEDLANLPPVSYIDARRELPARGFTVLYGRYGSGKTFVGLDYALAAALACSVVYVVGEGLHGMRARVLAWRSYHGVSPDGFRAIEGPVSLLDRRSFDALLGVISACNPELIVVDPLARFIPGVEENDAGEMGEVIAALDRIRTATGAGILVLHHAGKNGELRGSSALPCAADQVTRLTPTASGLVLKSEKAKDWEGFGERHLRLLPVPTGQLQPDNQPEMSCVVVPPEDAGAAHSVSTPAPRPKGAREALLAALAGPQFAESGAFVRDLVAATGLNEQSVRNVLGKLKRGQFILQERERAPYRIGDKGRAELARQG